MTRAPLLPRLFALLLGCAALCGVGHARAQTLERQHLGVQLRGLAAPAYLHAVQRIGDEQTQIDGAAVELQFALGAMVAEALALNMDLVLAHAPAAEHGVLQDTVFTALHVGAGITYWFMPANVYFGASLGLARSSVEGKPVRVDIEVPTSDPSKVGVGLHLALGKQWWVSQRVGLGASLSLLSSIASNPVGGEHTDRLLIGAALGFSATLH
jgi:hypothetical protein